MPSRDFSAQGAPANVALDFVQLFKALGGGWELTFADPPFRAGLLSAQR
jgi:hypothetical protein